MKKISLYLALISASIVSCGEKNTNKSNKSNKTDENRTESIVTPDPKLIADPVVQPRPVDPIVDPKPINPPAPYEKELTILFGENGKITLNNESGEYKIDSKISGNFDYSKNFSASGLFDSYETDIKYGYKSKLFPIGVYSYFQLPLQIFFDEPNSVAGKASNGKYDVAIQFWGNIKNGSKYYYACYKSVEHKYAILDFIIDSKDNKNKEYCDQLKNRINNNEILPLKINGNDYILLKFQGFRFYSSGDCFDENSCRISYKFDLNYYIQK